MSDIEKVIKGLEHCRLMCEGVSHNPCNGCTYQGSIDCADKLKTDALELMKEQKAKPDKCIICEGCGHKLQGDWNWCPWCRWETARGRQVKSVDFDKVFTAFRNCISEPKCKDCPWEQCEQFNQKKVTIPVTLALDVLNLLKEQGWNVLTEDADGFIHGLPGDDGQYLMTDGREIWIDDYMDGVDDGIFLDSGRDVHEIKAWMYMPKLP